MSGWAGFGLAGVLFAGQAGAAVPVEDMSTRDMRTAPPAAPTTLPATGTTSPGRNTQLFYELQVLQSEVQQLRGLIEDQAYEIRRLRDLQRSQYLDIDRRLTQGGRSVSKLPQNASAQPQQAQTQRTQTKPVPRVTVPVVQTGSGRPTPVVEPANDAPANQVAEKSVGRVVTPTEVVTAPSEQVAFDRAFQLMKDQQFEQSIAAYQSVVENFPDGIYAPQSRYWLGELYLMSDRLEAARGAFTSVVEVYPAHQKVPLSLYKLGVVNHRLGATPAALEYLDNVVTRYPDTPAAGLARTYAAELR